MIKNKVFSNMRWIILLSVIWQLSGCSSAINIASKDTYSYSEADQICVDNLLLFKQQVIRQQVSDAQLVWLPDYPHLAFDRLSLSLLPELNTLSKREQWLRYVSLQASEQRLIEYQNLTDKSGINFTTIAECAKLLTVNNHIDSAFWLQLQSHPPVYPSDYQTWQRVLGLYPITKLFIGPFVKAEQRRLFPVYDPPVAANVVEYGVNYAANISASDIRYDIDNKAMTNNVTATEEALQIRGLLQQTLANSELNWPLLTAFQARRLLAYFSPNWRIETSSNDDIPGIVAYDHNGEPGVDTSRTVVYSYVSYTRFQGQILPQLNYVLWFANRTANSFFDAYAGKFDSVLVRITLDKDGQPYIIDSIHSCGCYHMVFSLQEKLLFADDGQGIEQPITLQFADKMRPELPVTVTLTAKDHMVKGLVWNEPQETGPELQSLSLLPYRQLRSLPFSVNSDGQADQYKSLFDTQGMLMVSKRAERWFLWPFGIKSPGATRQTGHHAIVFVGQRHFDDAFIFESLFLAHQP